MGITIGERIHSLRKDARMSQLELAERLGVSQTAIYKYEKNQSEPDIKSLNILADLFQCTTDYLIGRTDIRSYGKEPAPAMREQALRIGEESINESRNVLLNDADMRQAIEDAVRRVLSEQQQVDH